jgi:hypothetical protein
MLQPDAAYITFNQPLRQMSVDVAMSQCRTFVCHLGRLHMLLSFFLDNTGSLICGSRLEEAVECCYGSNTKCHVYDVGQSSCLFISMKEKPCSSNIFEGCSLLMLYICVSGEEYRLI